MKRSLLPILLLVLLTASFATAKSPSKMYRSMSGETGSVYFIYPQSGFQCKDLKKNGSFEYDVTYLSSSDSLTVNASYYNTSAIPADSVVFISPDGARSRVGSSMIYVDMKKNVWQHRISLKMPDDYFAGLYDNDEPYRIELYAKGGSYVFAMSGKNWEKNKAVVSHVFEVIELNKK